jgi:2,4-dienoyl-CoA reductase-like NADH-dependent reductase (Old Yellow Enzyme family)
MTLADSFPRLAEPISIGPVAVPNRIVRSAHGTGLGQPRITDDLIEYHLRRAEDGVGLTVLEASSPHRTSPAPAGIDVSTDAVIEGYGRLVEALRPTGMKLFQQIHHFGAHVAPPDGSPAWAPSAVPSAMTGRMPQSMSEAQIEEIVAAFAAAAVRAEQGGLDGVEVQACHGFLLEQFLSPLTNHRDDEWGGDQRRRKKFASAVLAACREATGPDFAVGVRLSSTEIVEGGIDPAEALSTREAFEEQGLIDYLSVSMGSRYAYSKIIGPMHEPLGYELPLSEQICAGARVPTVAGGRVTTLGQAERIVADGIADMVSMVRATIVDDHLVRKSIAGHGSEVRTCNGCNHGCVAGLRQSPPRIGCALNPEAGRELRFAQAGRLFAERPAGGAGARVTVIGGGPAGLEAARAARLHGFEVTLLEAAGELGGQLTFARRAPLRAEIGDFADWAARELDRLGVEVRLDTEANAAMVLAERPDAIVLATGGEPVLAPGTVPSSAVLGRDPSVGAGRHVLVHDGLGHYEAIAVVDALIARGARVVYATDFDVVGIGVSGSLSAEPAAARFAAAGVEVRFRTLAGAIGPDDAEIVVEVGVRSPRDQMLAELRGTCDNVEVAGEAAAPGFLQEAVQGGRAAADRLTGALAARPPASSTGAARA